MTSRPARVQSSTATAMNLQRAKKRQRSCVHAASTTAIKDTLGRSVQAVRRCLISAGHLCSPSTRLQGHLPCEAQMHWPNILTPSSQAIIYLPPTLLCVLFRASALASTNSMSSVQCNLTTRYPLPPLISVIYMQAERCRIHLRLRLYSNKMRKMWTRTAHEYSFR
jgi:hypothetical protein